jgi:hypothetical protein
MIKVWICDLKYCVMLRSDNFIFCHCTEPIYLIGQHYIYLYSGFEIVLRLLFWNFCVNLMPVLLVNRRNQTVCCWINILSLFLSCGCNFSIDYVDMDFFLWWIRIVFVNKRTGCGLNDTKRRKIFLFAAMHRPALEPIQWLLGTPSLRVYWTENEADHSHLSRAKMRNVWSFAPTPMCLHDFCKRGQLYLSWYILLYQKEKHFLCLI